jgi:hypothetical protein
MLGGFYQILGMTGIIMAVFNGAVIVSVALTLFFIGALIDYKPHDHFISIPRIASKQVETVYNGLEGILKFLTQLLLLIIGLIFGGILWLMTHQ